MRRCCNYLQRPVRSRSPDRHKACGSLDIRLVILPRRLHVAALPADQPRNVPRPAERELLGADRVVRWGGVAAFICKVVRSPSR